MRDPVWATTWMADANECISPRIGLPPLAVVTDCVEVGLGAEAEGVLVRDTKDRSGPILRFGPVTWCMFRDQLKADGRNKPVPRQSRTLAGHRAL